MPLYAGLMSGTSLDGIDTAFADISILSGDPIRPHFAIVLRACGYTPYPAALRARLQEIRQGRSTTIADIAVLHYELGALYAEAATEAADQAGVRLSDTAALGLHGQTVWHAPPSSGAAVPATLQLGQPAILAERLSIPIVSDFRARDLAAGGEGAPLVPYADYALLHSSKESRVALNLGGIANITYLPADGTLLETLAFDTGPGNLILDGLSLALTGHPYDQNGALALSGHPDPILLEHLMTHPYFALPPPKSTGAEMFSAAYVSDFLNRARALSSADTLVTATRLTVDSIICALKDFLPCLPDRLIAGGGGTQNRAVMESLRQALPTVVVETHDTFETNAGIIPANAKESLAFALLAAARMNGLPANIPAATGARGPRLLGVVTLP